MRKIKMYNEYNTELVTLDFIKNKITESEYVKYLNTHSINEGLSSIISSIKEKIINGLLTFLDKLTHLKKESVKIAFQIFDKVKVLFDWANKIILSLKEKNPILFKIITIGIIVLFIMILTSIQAHAASNTVPIPTPVINYAIGYLHDYGIELFKEHHVSLSSIDKAIAILIDSRKNHGEISAKDVHMFGEEAVNIAKMAIRIGQSVSKDLMDFKDKGRIASDTTTNGEYSHTIVTHIIDNIKNGSKYLDYQFEHIKLAGGYNSETLRFNLAE